MDCQKKSVLSIGDVAAILDINILTAYKMARNNEFPVIKIGRSYRVPKEAFYKWFNCDYEDFSHNSSRES